MLTKLFSALSKNKGNIMIPFTFKDFKQLLNGLPSKGEPIAMTINGQQIDRVCCTKEDDGWHIDLHPVEKE